MEPSVIIMGLTCAVLVSFIGAECYFHQNIRQYNRIE